MRYARSIRGWCGVDHDLFVAPIHIVRKLGTHKPFGD